MKKALKWIGIGLGAIAGLLVVAVVVLQVITSSRVNKTYDIQVESITIPTDAASIERGEYLSKAIIGCNGCHGEDYAGLDFLNDPSIGLIYSANLTPGKGGAGSTYTDTDWVRALRHGVGPDGKPFMIMPSNQISHLTDEDLGAVIAFIKSVAPVDRESPKKELTFMAKTLFALGAFGKLPAEMIDHSATAPTSPAVGPTLEYGTYLMSFATCIDCHGANLTGGVPPAPAGPNITQGGELSAWGESDFITLMRTGKDRDGESVSADMPWNEHYKYLTDNDLKAIWAYLKSLPALPNNE